MCFDSELGFKSVFQVDMIDLILCLVLDVINEQVYKLYWNLVKIGYDLIEGVLNMEVIVLNLEFSQKFLNVLIKYVEGQVDQLILCMCGDQMQGVVESYNDVEVKVLSV